jgi:hypothetical protein
MSDLERRLSDLLHAGAPEPERIISASEIAEMAQRGSGPSGRAARWWGVPLLAAAAVLVAVAVPAIVVGHANNSVTPTSPPGAPNPAHTATGAPATSSPSSTPAPASTSPSSTASITPGPAATCMTGQLSLRAGLTSGAAGSLYTTFSFGNTGTPCSMRGFPGVSLLNDAGAIVGQPATRDGPTGPSVRLGVGQQAQFILRVGTATRTGCNLPRPSSQIEVYPPGQTVPMRIPFTTGSCAISVQSVTAAK